MSIRKTDFGIFVDKQSEFDSESKQIREWIEAAVADGWIARQTYELEKIDTAVTLCLDGWVAQVIMRPPKDKSRGNINISVWADDGLSIIPTFPYCFDKLLKAKRLCNYCGTKDIDTERVGFAGRCCKACLPKQRENHEYFGWRN